MSEFLRESGDRFQKTIVFCVDEEHAARMHQALVNENKDLCDQNERYVMRLTGSNQEGQAQHSNFIDQESKYPVIVTTSRLLSTGVDAQTCRLIVLDRPVGSMSEFKQIIGRGTRVHEDARKCIPGESEASRYVGHRRSPRPATHSLRASADRT